MLHGLEDNANTFDHLVCKLPQSYYYVSIDLPGHGKSDNLPTAGLPLQGMDYVYIIKLLVDYFERDKNIIIGHSFGAILGMQYALAYPEKLDKLFVIDTIWFEIISPTDFGTWMKNKFEEFSRISKQLPRIESASFTYAECLDIMTNWRYSNCDLTPKAVETLLRRSIKPIGNNKYKFTRDPRLKNYLCYPLDERYACDILNSHRIDFKLIVIITKERENIYKQKCSNLIEVYEKIGDWIRVDGNHHVHLNEPSIIADVINTYLDDVVPI